MSYTLFKDYINSLLVNLLRMYFYSVKFLPITPLLLSSFFRKFHFPYRTHSKGFSLPFLTQES